MILNGKYFLKATDESLDFKELMNLLIVEGVGRPVNEHGEAVSPWTPELLAEAISILDTRSEAIDIRTTQLWFQDNDKGVSNKNINNLAKVFGCGDPTETPNWRKALHKSQSILSERRKRGRSLRNELSSRFNLAIYTERVFTHRSPVNLPSIVFGLSVILCIVSINIGIHSFTIEGEDPEGFRKQIGFLWTPNWTILYLVVFPIFQHFVIQLVLYWRDRGRKTLLVTHSKEESLLGWLKRVELTSTSFWVIALISFPFFAGYQWISTRLLPILRNDLSNFPTDWGRISINHPEVVSSTEAVIFTGLAFLLMGLCCYLLFTSHVLIYTITDDLVSISLENEGEINREDLKDACEQIVYGTFRCMVFALLMPILVKLQSVYISTSSENIWAWLVADFKSVFGIEATAFIDQSLSVPGLYNSVYLAIAAFAIFLVAAGRIYSIASKNDLYRDATIGTVSFQSVKGHCLKFGAAIIILTAGYIAIGVINGFSYVLSVGLIYSLYLIFKPRLGHPGNKG